MPRIVRSGGLNVTDDVVRIKDLGPVFKPPKKEKAAPDLPLPEGGEDAAGLDFEPAFDEDFDEAQDALEDGTADAREDAPQPAGAAQAGSAQLAEVVQTEIINSAMAEASRIIEDALHKAEDARNGILAGVQDEADHMRMQAAEEGRKQGLDMTLEDVRGVANDLEQAVARFEGERAGFEAEYEEQLRWLSIEIASKVLAKKVSEDDAEMTEMVDKAVQSVRNEPWVRVEVSQEMVRLIDRLAALYEGQQNVEVSAVPTEPGTVHIETPSGVVDASLRTQLANLKEYFAAGGV